MIVPTLRVGMQPVTLCVTSKADAERPVRHSHAERGNDHQNPMIALMGFCFCIEDLCRSGRANQMIERAERCLGTLAHSNDNLLIRHRGYVTGSEHPRQ